MKKKLILFTDTYPYGNREQFIEEEVKYLARYFSLIIVPSRLKKTKRRDIPENAICELGLAKSASHARVGFEATSFSLLYPEISSRISVGFHILELARLIYSAGTANLTLKWLSRYIMHKGIELNNTIFYTYWLNATTLGISRLKETYPDLKLVSRCHGYDLYEERYNPPYIAFQKETLSRVDKLFLISDHGIKYIMKKYPSLNSLFYVAKLGILGPDPENIAKKSEDGTFRIVSCSFAVPVKRLDLLLTGVVKLAKEKPFQMFEWYHIGDGPEMRRLKAEASKFCPSNLEIHFLGYLPHIEVLNFYSNNPVDVFVNVSSSEGIPVSIMEAQAYGIPVVATAVGGSPEIVSDLNGKLLSSHPSHAEVAEAINSFLENPDTAKSKRIESRINWEINYNANKNYEVFIKVLKE